MTARGPSTAHLREHLPSNICSSQNAQLTPQRRGLAQEQCHLTLLTWKQLKVSSDERWHIISCDIRETQISVAIDREPLPPMIAQVSAGGSMTALAPASLGGCVEVGHDVVVW